MAIVRWNLARDLMQMREEMDRLFSQFLRRSDGEEGTWAQGLWAPPVDIYESDDAFMLKAELPGFSREDVNIEVHENPLIIRGERKRESEAPVDPQLGQWPAASILAVLEQKEPKDIRRRDADPGRYQCKAISQVSRPCRSCLMQLFPQPTRNRSSVEYVPVPYGGRLGQNHS